MQGMELTSGGALRAQAARLAVRAATYLVEGDTESRPSLEGFSFVHQLAEDGDLRITAIEWETKTQSPSRDEALVSAHWQSTSDDPDVDALRQMRAGAASSGRHGEVALYCDFITKLLEERFHADPIDREARLAEESLRSGLLWTETGQFDAAIQSLMKAERASHTLAELRPTETIHTFFRSAALTLLGFLYSRTGRNDDAHKVLAEAVTYAQRLTDEGTGNEGLLVISLSMHGLHFLQLGEFPRAVEVLARSVTISERLSRQSPRDFSLGMLHTNARLSLGVLYLQLEDWEAAEGELDRAVAAAEKIARDVSNWPAQLLLCNAFLSLGTVHVVAERTTEAEAVLLSCVSAAQRVVDSASDGSRFGIERAQFVSIIGSAHFFLGVVYLAGEAMSAAEMELVECISTFGLTPPDEQKELMVSHAFDFLAELYEDQGRTEDAESARSRQLHIG